MNSLQSLLVGTDFSMDSGYALARALVLAREHGCHSITLVHAQEPDLIGALKALLGNSAANVDRVREAIQERLDKVVSDNFMGFDGTISKRIIEGRALDVLAELALVHDAVVVGARGIHQIRERLLGTLPQRLLGRIDRPLLVVHQAPRESYDRVVVGTDFSADAERALALAAAFMPAAALHVVHAFRHSEELAMLYANVGSDLIETYRSKARQRSEVELLRFVAASGLPSDRVTAWVESGDPALVLRMRAAAVEAQLIVVGKRGTTQAEELLFGSVVQRLLAETACDLLVTPRR